MVLIAWSTHLFSHGHFDLRRFSVVQSKGIALIADLLFNRRIVWLSTLSGHLFSSLRNQWRKNAPTFRGLTQPLSPLPKCAPFLPFYINYPLISLGPLSKINQDLMLREVVDIFLITKSRVRNCNQYCNCFFFSLSCLPRAIRNE